MSKTSQPTNFGQGIIKDNVNVELFKKLNYAVSCEDCTHFLDTHETCTIGYPTTPHLKRNQEKEISETGQIAFCRTYEID